MKSTIIRRNRAVPPQPIHAATATTTGATTGTIPVDAYWVNVTCDNADKIIILPTPSEIMIGKTLIIVRGATNAVELRSNSPTTVAINGTVGADVELALAANTLTIATLIYEQGWEVVTIAGGITGITYGTPD